MIEYFDVDGKPLTLFEWSAKFELGLDYRLIKCSDVGPYRVSTIWLGLDHSSPLSEGPPLIFETMVFFDGQHHEATDRERAFDLECLRWSTREESIEGHDELVTLILATTQSLEAIDVTERAKVSGAM